MKVAIATKNGVRCPECKIDFEVDPEFYNKEVECPECSCGFKIKPPPTPTATKNAGPKATTSSDTLVEDDSSSARMEPMSTVKLTRDKATMEQMKDNMPAPKQQDVSKAKEVEVSNDKVSCPSCSSSFEVEPEFYGSMGVCPDCEAEFIIRRPTPSGSEDKGEADFGSIKVRSTTPRDNQEKPAPTPTSTGRKSSPKTPIPDVTTSGIEVMKDNLAPKYAATATVRLNRNMSMAQQSKEEMKPPPPPEEVAKLKEVHAVDDEVTCPGCESSFEITSEFYGAVAECPDCEAEFIIRPPADKTKPESGKQGKGNNRAGQKTGKPDFQTEEIARPANEKKAEEDEPVTPTNQPTPVAKPDLPPPDAKPLKKRNKLLELSPLAFWGLMIGLVLLLLTIIIMITLHVMG